MSSSIGPSVSGSNDRNQELGSKVLGYSLAAQDGFIAGVAAFTKSAARTTLSQSGIFRLSKKRGARLDCGANRVDKLIGKAVWQRAYHAIGLAHGMR
jgi:hypothetical protein